MPLKTIIHGPEKAFKRDECVCAPALLCSQVSWEESYKKAPSVVVGGRGQPCKGVQDAAGPGQLSQYAQAQEGREECGDREGRGQWPGHRPWWHSSLPFPVLAKPRVPAVLNITELQTCQNISTKSLFLLSSFLRISKKKKREFLRLIALLLQYEGFKIRKQWDIIKCKCGATFKN